MFSGNREEVYLSFELDNRLVCTDFLVIQKIKKFTEIRSKRISKHVTLPSKISRDPYDENIQKVEAEGKIGEFFLRQDTKYIFLLI